VACRIRHARSNRDWTSDVCSSDLRAGWATMGLMTSSHPNPPARSSADAPAPQGPMVDQPAKVMRIGTMIRQLLEEVRSAPLDDEIGRASRRDNMNDDARTCGLKRE